MGDRLVRAADTQILVSKVREVGRRSRLDMAELVKVGLVVANRNSSNVLDGIWEMSSDGTVTPQEKRQLELLLKQLDAEYPTTVTEADRYSELSAWKESDQKALDSYKGDYAYFASLLRSLLKDMDSSTPVSRDTLTNAAEMYYSSLKALDEVLQGYRYGIDTIEFTYAATAEQTAPKADDITATEPPSLSSSKRFMWRRQTIRYTNGRTEVSVELIAVYGDTGDAGESFTVTIESSNGSLFRPGDVSTTLSCHVYINMTEVTEDIAEDRFRWYRHTDDSIGDERWNTSSKAIGHRSVEITSQDCSGRTVFDCEVDI